MNACTDMGRDLLIYCSRSASPTAKRIGLAAKRMTLERKMRQLPESAVTEQFRSRVRQMEARWFWRESDTPIVARRSRVYTISNMSPQEHYMTARVERMMALCERASA